MKRRLRWFVRLHLALPLARWLASAGWWLDARSAIPFDPSDPMFRFTMTAQEAEDFMAATAESGR